MSSKTRQEQEFLEAFENYSDELFRHCSFRISDRERAVDIVQDAFTKTWNYLVSGGEIREFRSFLYRTLNNLIIDEYRKRKTVSLDAILEEQNVVEGMFEELREGSLQELEEKLDAKQFLTELEALPNHYKEVVIMRYIDGLSPPEIADIIGTNENVVSVRIHRGLAWLRKNSPYAHE